ALSVTVLDMHPALDPPAGILLAPLPQDVRPGQGPPSHPVGDIMDCHRLHPIALLQRLLREPADLLRCQALQEGSRHNDRPTTRARDLSGLWRPTPAPIQKGLGSCNPGPAWLIRVTHDRH